VAEKQDAGAFRPPFEQSFPDMLTMFLQMMAALSQPRSEPRLGGESISPYQMAVPWGPGPIRFGAPKPTGPQHEAALQDIKLAMSRLLRGNMPVKEADPRMVRQFEQAGRRQTGPYQELSLLGRLGSEHEWTNPGVRVPALQSSASSPPAPIMMMKSEAYGPPFNAFAGQYVQFLKALEALGREGLWP